jgi:hypothetical protein
MDIRRMLPGLALAGGLAMTSALAQQEGLVNVSVDGNTVQVPIAVAANVCGVSVAVLADYEGTDRVVCEIDQDTAAQHNIQINGGDGGDDNGEAEGPDDDDTEE